MSKAQSLLRAYPWLEAPVIVSAPMRVLSGAKLAVAVTRAGGLGFIGPGADPSSTATELQSAKELLEEASFAASRPAAKALPVGVGFQTWNGSLASATAAIEKYHPSAAWLFAPRHGQAELDEWTRGIRQASPQTQIWVQVGTLREAVDAVKSQDAPDVLVVQGAEAGGHGRATDGMGLFSLLPEVVDAVRDSSIPVMAAGGIVDGRGVIAALGLGASGIVMGTRFLASSEARISKGYQNAILASNDGAVSTTRTQLYNHLRGTFDWPEQFSPRTIINQSWRDHEAGVAFQELKKRHDEVVAQGDKAWGEEGRTATYAGASIGLIHNVKDAGAVVQDVRKEVSEIAGSLQSHYGSGSS
ncbi:hypothetical protein S40285_04612 [Stachybotrys chlorohalonatus IBT 40285]|uniref:Uncharacterized protein n=1 Tax=Stachybotrys chlorohalonatus (strain IBT 40285) TaxID=1283841 RepID=A0A084QZR7_STAC4|nr:hypothetical protein S40285_04612 [Stachybotrys chlorohalonata IBT 40285]